MLLLFSESEMAGINVHDECESSEDSPDVSVPVPPEIGVVSSKAVVFAATVFRFDSLCHSFR